MKKENGITIVALVVTIIILIILAGISINLILGDNGIITVTKKAKENTELAKVEEEKELNELYTQLETNGASSSGTNNDAIAKLIEFKTAIANYIEEAGGVKPEVTADTIIYGKSIKEIVKEVKKNKTATADNISEGKTAWVNGELITGTGKDNETKYNEGATTNKMKVESMAVNAFNVQYFVPDGWTSETISSVSGDIYGSNTCNVTAPDCDEIWIAVVGYSYNQSAQPTCTTNKGTLERLIYTELGYNAFGIWKLTNGNNATLTISKAYYTIERAAKIYYKK